MKNSDTLLRALVARREAVHRLLVSTSHFSTELTALVKQSRADLKPALSNLQGVVNLLLKNQTNLDESLRLMAPFYRVFANTLGDGPWFDTWISNLPPAPVGGWLMKIFNRISPADRGRRVVVAVVAALLVDFWPGSDQKTIVRRLPAHGLALRGLGREDPRRRRRQGRLGRARRAPRCGSSCTTTPSTRCPPTPKAAVISPSIVGDRFVQLTPAYNGGEVMPKSATLGLDKTATPLELDEIFRSLNDLNIALGPDGANKADAGGVGPLTRLLDSTARNFGGQGVQFNKTLKNLGAFTKTLSDNKDELFGTLSQVEKFTNTLSKNDKTVRDFNDSLASGANLLADERQDLAAVLRNLSTAMTEVRWFVKENRASLTSNISGLNRISKTLVKRRDALDKTLRVRADGPEQPLPRGQREAGHAGHP